MVRDEVHKFYVDRRLLLQLLSVRSLFLAPTGASPSIQCHREDGKGGQGEDEEAFICGDTELQLGT